MEHKKEKEFKLKIYKTEESEEYDEVSDDKFLNLVNSSKISYSVYKKKWFYITVLILVLILFACKYMI